MTDAPPTAKSGKAPADSAADGKKRFEVKKVRTYENPRVNIRIDQK